MPDSFGPVVITGASSGIGRATAHAFARRGAALVLAARREEALHEAAAECRALGGQAIVAPTDVTDSAAVDRLAETAMEAFGGIGVWFNNAAVSLFARFEEAPMDVFRRVVETNLWGYVHGARAALPAFRAQGRGVLINNASVVAIVGQPYTSAYVMSKFAIRGLGDCLRQELRNAPGVHVCTLLPAAFDTPIFENAANFTGRPVQAMSPVYDAKLAAEAVVRLASWPRRELVVGAAGRALALANRVAPGLAERVMGRVVERRHFGEGAAPATAGTTFETAPGRGRISGGRRTPAPRSKVPLILLGAVLAAALPLSVAAMRRAR